jgi:imidazolonepropionase-like amidohydrolase
MNDETVLRGCRLIDGTGLEPQIDAGVVFAGGIIRQAGPVDTLRFDKAATVVDLDGRTVLPGLIDSHTHLTYHAAIANVWEQEFKESLELNTLRAAENARAILGMGFTTIGDGGCRGFIAPAVRDAVALGLIAGPDIVSAGPILCGPAGLLDNTPPWIRQEIDGALAEIVESPQAARRAVRRQVKGDVDWIKVAATGVAGSRYSNAETPDLGEPEIHAVVDEARKFGKPVHAHAHGDAGVRAAVRAGVLSLHGGEFATDETLCLIRDGGVLLGATIAWLHARCLPGAPGSENAAFVDEAWRAFAASRDMLIRAKELGVRIALATDAAHRFPHVPDGVLEMEYLCACGYAPLEAITCATAHAAESIGRGAEIGTLRRGKRADILIVDGDPSADIRVLRDKRRIWRLYRKGREIPLEADRGYRGKSFRVSDWIGLSLAETRARPKVNRAV